jgi:hypothetical protein
MTDEVHKTTCRIEVYANEKVKAEQNNRTTSHRGIDTMDALSETGTCECVANRNVKTRSSETMRISSRPNGCVLGRGY